MHADLNAATDQSVGKHADAVPLAEAPIEAAITPDGSPCIVAVPLGLGAAIFLAELAPPKISSWLAFLIDLLAAVPSVIYGLLGIFIMVPFLRTVVDPALQKSLGFLPLFQGPIYGVGLLAGGLILFGILVLSLIGRTILRSMPRARFSSSRSNRGGGMLVNSGQNYGTAVSIPAPLIVQPGSDFTAPATIKPLRNTDAPPIPIALRSSSSVRTWSVSSSHRPTTTGSWDG